MEGNDSRFLTRLVTFVVPPLAVGLTLFGFFALRGGKGADADTHSSMPVNSAASPQATQTPSAPAPAPTKLTPETAKPGTDTTKATPDVPKPAADASNVPPQTPPVPAGDAPSIVFEGKDFDFGTVFSGEKVEHHYPFKNAGKGPLTINSVKGSCGCTEARAMKSSLEPGEASDIKAVFDSTGRPGQNDKTITITTNDPKDPQVILRLHGLVRDEVWTDPPQIQLGQLRRGQKLPDHTIKVISMKSHPVEITEVTASKPEIQIVQKPYETETEKGIEVHLAFPDWKAWINPSRPNYLAEWVKVKTSSTKIPYKQIMLYGQILEDIVCEPKFLSFQAVKQGEEAEKQLLITGSPEITFHLPKIEKTFAGIETELKTVEDGKKYIVVVKLLKTAPVGRFRDTIKIVTDYADQDSVTVYAYGAVRDPSEPDAPPVRSTTPTSIKVNGFHDAIVGRTTDKDVVKVYGEPTKRDPVPATGGTTLAYVGATHNDLLPFESVEFEVDPKGLLKEIRLNYKKN